MDQIDADILADAQEAVKRSASLCFLGFAYADENLKRLGLPEASHRGVDGEFIRRPIYGTAFDMRKGEIMSVMDNLPGAELGGETEGCFDFLRNHHVFRG